MTEKGGTIMVANIKRILLAISSVGNIGFFAYLISKETERMMDEIE